MCSGMTIEQQAYALTHLCRYTDCCPANHISKDRSFCPADTACEQATVARWECMLRNYQNKIADAPDTDKAGTSFLNKLIFLYNNSSRGVWELDNSIITVGDKMVAVGAMTCSNNRSHVVTEKEMYNNVDYMVAACNKIPTLIAMINHLAKKAASCENDSSYVEKINEAYHVVTNSGDLVDVCKINVYEQKDNASPTKE